MLVFFNSGKEQTFGAVQYSKLKPTFFSKYVVVQSFGELQPSVI